MPSPSAPNTPVRVLQVITGDGVGGTEQMVPSFVLAADPMSVECEVATLAPPGPVAARLASAGIRVWSLGGGHFPVAAFRLIRRIRRGRYDVIATYGLKGAWLGRVAVRLARPRPAIVCGVHTQHMSAALSAPHRIHGPLSRATMAIERLSERLVDSYEANSSGAASLLQRYGVDSGRIRVVPNGQDLEPFRMRLRPVGSSTPIRIACVARMTPIKRQEDLVRAAAILRERGVIVELVFAGDGETLEEVRELVEAEGLSERVRADGSMAPDEVSALLRASDVFCLPSLSEGLPGSVMEAMAAGLPVVGTDVNGTRDLVEQGETGLLVEPGRPELLADAIESLAADRDRMRAMGAAGRARIEAEWSLEAMVRAKTALYRQVAPASAG